MPNFWIVFELKIIKELKKKKNPEMVRGAQCPVVIVCGVKVQGQGEPVYRLECGGRKWRENNGSNNKSMFRA